MFTELSIIIILTWLIYHLVKGKESKERYPPGPWGFPIVGHLPLLGLNPHEKLLQWRKIYGPIFSVRFGTFDAIVLTDPKLIKEAFNLPALAGRAQLKPMMVGTEGKGLIFSEGQWNTEQRQFVLRSLRDFGMGRNTIESSIHNEIQEVLDDLKLRSGHPTQVKHMFSTRIINSMWSILIGQRFEKEDGQPDEFMPLINKVGEAGTILSQLALFLSFIANLMPNLSGYNDKVSTWQTIRKFVSDRIDERKRNWVKGQPKDFTDAYFDKVDETTDETSSFHAKNNFQPQATADCFMAAGETTSSALEWLINWLGRHPQVQQKLQEEIDRVIGQSRLSSINDRPHCPYTEATISELLRYSNVVPIGVWHRALEQVEFHGYKIPKGVTIISNLYGAHFDENVWGDPQNFRPERFIGEDGKLKKFENLLSFSTGKRTCIGESLAREQLFLYTTSLCQKFDILIPEGTPEINGTFGFTYAPPPFEATFIERRI